MRLVVYAGAARARDAIYNEKVLAGLGKTGSGGKLPEKGRARAIRALRRFRRLIDDMNIRTVRCVATAAVRDAADGPEFVREVRSIGLPCRVLSDQAEAQHAGQGVLYAIPGANGIAADLGGGSLELIDLDGQRTGPGVSLPLGVLRVDPSESGLRQARKAIRAALKETGLTSRGRPLYLVGGSWRALARIDMAVTDYPLPITHLYRMANKRARELARVTTTEDPIWTSAAPPARHATAHVAAMLLEMLTEEMGPKCLIVSAAGIREGLLYSSLRASTRRLDPLIEAARERGGEGPQADQHGEQLDRWIGGLFTDDEPGMKRLRRASCLLADVALQAVPAFRAERAIETALHGNWFGVDAGGRVLMAQALSSSFGTSDLPDPRLDELCQPAELHRAHLWGLAIRLGQRLSAGVGAILERAPLEIDGDRLLLALRRSDAALASEAVVNRLERLGEALGLEASAG